jgi:WD40 repeat protein
LGKYQPRLVSQNPYSIGDTSVSFSFSPNSKQLVLQSKLKRNIYLIDLTQNESKQNLIDITQTFDKILLDWQQLSKQSSEVNLSKLPKTFFSTIATNPASISFSDDDTKFLYSLNKQYFVYDTEKELNHLF